MATAANSAALNISLSANDDPAATPAAESTASAKVASMTLRDFVTAALASDTSANDVSIVLGRLEGEMCKTTTDLVECWAEVKSALPGVSRSRLEAAIEEHEEPEGGLDGGLVHRTEAAPYSGMVRL